ncbi:hypothetical protein [Saccharospirillum salsuginis]|uniref:Uncharacterized protein n=1 Tax=Saccharospirillum salsuginis TaxID=418750 RepID=A0A918KUL3_9GAMM|nr:hypothetical protein [Saccharospirillum salsuginis]GGX74067.1 hypothetical protein GCM10007392_46800 [Saccharospirillum salsuginis]
MRGILFAALATLGSVITANAEDFGVADWGDSRQSVRDTEERTNRTPLGVGDYLIYEAELASIHRTRLVYQFEQDQLVRGRFLFQPPDNAPVQIWVEQFDQVRNLISQQYGEPRSTQQLRPTGETNLAPGDRASALAADRLILKTRWVSNGTEIIQQLAWNQSQPHHQVIYRPLGSDNAGGMGESAF